jgi:hypothetical protein
LSSSSPRWPATPAYRTSSNRSTATGSTSFTSPTAIASSQEGHIDFRPGFVALKEAGYDGYLGIECRISVPYDDEALAESAALLRELWDAA